MGLRGLASFIKTCSYREPGVLVDFKLYDCAVIIDGNNLYHYLYYTGPDQCQYGDYGVYAKSVQHFFDVLTQCGVTPIVVFDGAHNLSDEKLEYSITKGKSYINKRAKEIAPGKDKLSPILLYEVFLKILQDKKIECITSLYEADQDIAALAKKNDCPIISDDSDFFIFHFNTADYTRVSCSFLPLKYIRLDKLQRNEENKFFLNAKQYRIQQFSTLYFPDATWMLVLAAILGNDAIRDKIKCKNVEQVVWWLKSQSSRMSLEEVIATFTGSSIRACIMTSLDSFKVPDDIRQTTDLPPHCQALPEWFIKDFKNCKLSSVMLKVLIGQSIFNMCQIEDIYAESSHNCAKQIREVIYGILLGEGDVSEYTREGEDLRQYTVQPKRDLPIAHSSKETILGQLSTMNRTEREKFMFKSVGIQQVAVDVIRDEMKLAWATVLYWVDHAGDTITKKHIVAMLVAMLGEDAIATVGHYIEQTHQDYEFNIKIVHGFEQFQSCLMSMIDLNKLLRQPLPTPDVTEIFKGTFLHKLWYALDTADEPGVFKQHILWNLPDKMALFNELHSAVKRYTRYEEKRD